METNLFIAARRRHRAFVAGLLLLAVPSFPLRAQERNVFGEKSLSEAALTGIFL